MNANCLDEKRNFKACPYRVITEERKAVLRGYGDFVTQQFTLVSVKPVSAIMLEFV